MAVFCVYSCISSTTRTIGGQQRSLSIASVYAKITNITVVVTIAISSKTAAMIVERNGIESFLRVIDRSDRLNDHHSIWRVVSELNHIQYDIYKRPVIVTQVGTVNARFHLLQFHIRRRPIFRCAFFSSHDSNAWKPSDKSSKTHAH